MKRFHVHVAVDHLADSIKFYSGMFAAEPSVIKDDYAKWMLDDPRVNFAISQRGAEVGLNHLGMQVESVDESDQMERRLKALQPDVEKDEAVACCYAKSDKYWVTDPSGIAWETFQTLDTIPVFGQSQHSKGETASCCIPAAKQKIKPSAASCCNPATSNSNSNCC